jgi:hypothetical protein
MKYENLCHHATLCDVCATFFCCASLRRGVVLPIEAASRSTFCFWATGDLGLKGKVVAVRTESRVLAAVNPR